VASCAGARMTETVGVSPGATGEVAAGNCARAGASAAARRRAPSCAGTYSRCARLRSHHVSKRVQSTRTRMRTGLVGPCTALLAGVPTATVLA